MTVRRQPLDQALDRIKALTAHLWLHRPDLVPDLNRIDHAADQLAHWLPRAHDIITRSVLQSPSMEPHRGAGGHGDPVLALVEADWGDTGRTKRGHAGRLDQAADHIRTAHQDLARAAGGVGPTIRGQHRHGGDPGLRIPPATAAEQVADARHGLDRALSLVQATMPKSYDLKKLRLDNPPACANCLEHGHHAEAAADRGGLCRWCADTRRAIGRNPDGPLVDAHHNGRRITRVLMDQLDRAAERRRTKQRANRKAGRR